MFKELKHKWGKRITNGRKARVEERAKRDESYVKYTKITRVKAVRALYLPYPPYTLHDCKEWVERAFGE